MATNVIYEESGPLKLGVTAAPNTTVKAGDPVLVGQKPGIALTNGDDTVSNKGKATVKFDGVGSFAVKGETTTNAAVAVGDIIYYDSGVLNKDSSNGVRFGYALETVVSGATTTIKVLIGY